MDTKRRPRCSTSLNPDPAVGCTRACRHRVGGQGATNGDGRARAPLPHREPGRAGRTPPQEQELLVERRRRAFGHGAVDPQSLDTSSPGKRVLRFNQKNSKSLISLEKNPSVQVLRREALLSRRLRRCWIFKIRRQQRFAAGRRCVACSTRRTSRRLAAPGRRSRSSASSPARACP